MVMAWLAPDPDAKSLRAELLSKEILDSLAYCLQIGPYTSAEVHKDATVKELLDGGGGSAVNEGNLHAAGVCRVHGHFGSSSPKYYKHWNDPEWAVIFDTDCVGDANHGRRLIEPVLQDLIEKTDLIQRRPASE